MHLAVISNQSHSMHSLALIINSFCKCRAAIEKNIARKPVYPTIDICLMCETSKTAICLLLSYLASTPGEKWTFMSYNGAYDGRTSTSNLPFPTIWDTSKKRKKIIIGNPYDRLLWLAVLNSVMINIR